jgi:hypothetical protein
VAQSRAATWHPGTGFWSMVGLLNLLWVHGVQPPDLSPPLKALTKANPSTCHALVLERQTSFKIFELEIGCKWWGVGPGLSPDLDSMRNFI